MTLFKLTSYSLMATGIGFAVFGVIKYSDFLARLHKVAPGELETVDFENPAEGWSVKNWRIVCYLWQMQYLGKDTQLNVLGNSVRRLNIISLAFVLVAIILMIVGAE